MERNHTPRTQASSSLWACLALAVLDACSSGASNSEDSSGTAHAGSASMTVAGSGGSAGGGGATFGPSSSGGSSVSTGGSAIMDSSGGAGNGCSIESFHLEVSGGLAFERSLNAADTCGGGLGGDPTQLVLSFSLMPPEVENTVLLSVIADQVKPGDKGTFSPSILSVLATGGIWSRDANPDAPLACSLILDENEPVGGKRWRVAGSVTCEGALPGIGILATAPLSIADWSFSLLVIAADT